jgi:archaellum component FlaC
MSPLTEFTEKYLKKLVGRTEIEDAMKRLDKLTQEEARMATAQTLKVAHAVDDRVLGIDNRVAGVDDRVASVDNRVAGVDDRVAGVDDKVAGVEDKVKAVDDKVASVIDGAHLINHYRISLTQCAQMENRQG